MLCCHLSLVCERQSRPRKSVRRLSGVGDLYFDFPYKLHALQIWDRSACDHHSRLSFDRTWWRSKSKGGGRHIAGAVGAPRVGADPVSALYSGTASRRRSHRWRDPELVAAGYHLEREQLPCPRRAFDLADRRMFLVQQCFHRCAGLCDHRHADPNRMGSARSRHRCDSRRRDDPGQCSPAVSACVERRVPFVLARRCRRAIARNCPDAADSPDCLVGRNSPEACVMNRAIIRGLCLLTLVASVAVRFQANQTREAMTTDFDAGAAVTDVIRKHGYVVRENPIKPPKLLSAVIYFQRPECDQASLVLPYFINAETLPLLARVTGPDFDHHFYCMSRSWNEQDRVSMLLEWAKYAVL